MQELRLQKSHGSPLQEKSASSLRLPAQMPNVRLRVFIPRYWASGIEANDVGRGQQSYHAHCLWYVIMGTIWYPSHPWPLLGSLVLRLEHVGKVPSASQLSADSMVATQTIGLMDWTNSAKRGMREVIWGIEHRCTSFNLPRWKNKAKNETYGFGNQWYTMIETNPRWANLTNLFTLILSLNRLKLTSCKAEEPIPPKNVRKKVGLPSSPNNSNVILILIAIIPNIHQIVGTMMEGWWWLGHGSTTYTKMNEWVKWLRTHLATTALDRLDSN